MMVPTRAQRMRYAEDGYYLARALLGPEEVATFRDRARAQLEAEAQSQGG
jgi:hypothetical protein